jgi:hypothetical protein
VAVGVIALSTALAGGWYLNRSRNHPEPVEALPVKPAIDLAQLQRLRAAKAKVDGETARETQRLREDAFALQAEAEALKLNQKWRPLIEAAQAALVEAMTTYPLSQEVPEERLRLEHLREVGLEDAKVTARKLADLQAKLYLNHRMLAYTCRCEFILKKYLEALNLEEAAERDLAPKWEEVIQAYERILGDADRTLEEQRQTNLRDREAEVAADIGKTRNMAEEIAQGIAKVKQGNAGP